MGRMLAISRYVQPKGIAPSYFVLGPIPAGAVVRSVHLGWYCSVGYHFEVGFVLVESDAETLGAFQAGVPVLSQSVELYNGVPTLFIAGVAFGYYTMVLPVHVAVVSGPVWLLGLALPSGTMAILRLVATVVAEVPEDGG